MSIDEILRTSIDEVARGITPPPPDLVGVRRRARATRRRQWVAAAAGTAAVVVGGVAIAAGLPGQSPTPPVDNPTPSPSRVAQVQEEVVWSDGKTLHFGSDEVAAPDTIFGFALVDGGAVYTLDDVYELGDRVSQVMFQPKDGGAAQQIGDNAQLSPAGDPTSGLASWIEAQGNDGSLVVFDTQSNQELARTSVTPPVDRNDNIIFAGISPVISVSATAVYFYGPDKDVWVWRWSAGEAPESTGETGVLDVAAGVSAQAGDEEDSIDFVSADGSTLATTESAGGYTALGTLGGHLNPDGSLFASFDPEGRAGLLVSDTSTGKTTELVLPDSEGEPGSPFGMGWSGNDTLMVTVTVSGDLERTELTSQVVACTLSTGDCRVVATEDGLFVTVPSS